jgi:hypothetical protein
MGLVLMQRGYSLARNMPAIPEVQRVPRQLDSEYRSFARLTFDIHVSMVFSYDAVDHRQSETVAFPIGFGGVKGFENPRQFLRINSTPCVGDRQADHIGALVDFAGDG